MKRYYLSMMMLAMMMLAMMVTALSFTACSKSGDDVISKIEPNTDSTKPITVNGNKRTINLKTAGTLSSFISEEDAPNIVELKLSGHMDARDFDFIKWKCMKIEVVDMADVVIDEYEGADGTNEGYDATYGANEIPVGAFFYWKTSRKYDYPGMPTDEGMASLKKIVLPQGITAIRRNAFARAYNLTEINIPEGVKEIDFVAFAICQSMKEITLPSTLKKVGKQAFADMTSIEKMTVLTSTPPAAESNSFQGITNKATLYVPKGARPLYAKATGWKDFATIDDGESSTEIDYSSVVGVWEIVDYETNIQGKSSKGERMNFKADGTFTYSESFNKGTWTFDGNTIIVTANNNQTKCIIDSYTGNELTLRAYRDTYYAVMYLKRVTDENNNPGDSPSSSTFTITYDGERNEVENTSWINPLFGNGGTQKGNYFCLDNYPLNRGQIHIIFPYDQYGGNVPPSYFTVGYSDFGEYATDIEFISAELSGWHGEYVSGSAKVTKNDGKNITIQFSRYAFEVTRSGKSHNFILDGTLTFMAYLYD